MFKRNIAFIILVLFTSEIINSQDEGRGIIEGRIFNSSTNEPVPFASTVIWGTNIGSVSDLDGRFIFTGIKPGYVELRASSVGFKQYISEPILVTNANKVFIDIPLEETVIAIDEITVKASPYRRKEESPVSLRRISIEEIDKNPGGNRDISKVIQSYPGVGSTVSFRNDLIVRGGGAGENRFYLDGVEIPNLNHFATQGASGGPVGILNVDFIREVNFYSGAFPSNRGNALSSVLEFRQIDGNKDKLKFRGSVGASDLALTLDGPIGPSTTFIASARRSYLQFLFSVLELPFLPTYNDFQFKVRSRINEKNEIILLGLGSFDVSSLNLKANETEEQRYILSYLPVNEQWSYTFGMVYKHYRKKGADTWVISRNHLNNGAYKYYNNIETDTLKIYDYKSNEIENKFRFENTSRYDNGIKLNWGVNLEYAQYTNNTFNRGFANDVPITINYNSDLNLFEWGLFSQVSKGFAGERLTLSLGVRMDANSYSKEMNNFLNQVSPRFSLSYLLFPKWYLNFNTGRYFQQPPYTMMGFRDNNGEPVNKQNGLKYIRADHVVSGFEFLPDENSRISLEGFYKWYDNYPVSYLDKVSLASKGGDFGTFGDEEVLSIARGRAYGIELLYRNRDLAGFNVVLAYTLFRSKSQEISQTLQPADNYIPSAWDNKHLLNITSIRKFKKDWQIGFKWRFLGGAPYTPWDLATSQKRPAWDAQGIGYLDYNQYNSLRLKGFNQLDVRADKEYFFDKWTLTFYVDIQNILNLKADQPDNLFRVEDANGNPVIINPSDPYEDQLYQLKMVQPEVGTVLPTIGIIIEF
ncbi:MAG: hypothetical protein AMS27_08260 [Bacteroides sp. SM23_62_1]|nr:MAG: hypothetical protein AMS27_08260 [Bacteroides sp. SM23_62_1]